MKLLFCISSYETKRDIQKIANINHVMLMKLDTTTFQLKRLPNIQLSGTPFSLC